jgi:hypothetical protein
MVQSLMSMRQKSVTVDEIMYITAGYYHLRTGDFQFNMTNPPFMKMLSALPLLFVDPDLPDHAAAPDDQNLIAQWQFSRSFLYGNRVDADTILFWARIPIIIVSIILGLYLFRWSREVYGTAAGLFALFLYSFSPNILAHSRLATQDIGLTAFMFIAAFYFWRYLKQRNSGTLLLCGLFFGLAFITKTVALILLPIFLVYGLIVYLKYPDRLSEARLPLVNRLNKRRLRQLATLAGALLVVGLVGAVVLNLGYGLQGAFRPIDSQYLPAVYARLPLGGRLQEMVGKLLGALPRPVPWPFLRSLGFQTGLVAESSGVYFAGNLYENGLWYLMPASFLIKTPLPTLILLTLAAIFLAVRRIKLDAEWLMLTVVAATFLLFIVFSNTIVGLRYILPIYPFVFLLISSLLRSDFRLSGLLASLIIVLSIWYVAGTVRIYPHYLAYFNETVGGPANGYKYLVDSNVDWGQDLKGLKAYMDENGIDSIKLAYFGSADADYYGINYEYLPSVGLEPQKPGQYWWYEMTPENDSPLPPQQGTIAVSATILASPGWMQPLFQDSYAWLREHEPVDHVGYSILIYQIQ